MVAFFLTRSLINERLAKSMPGWTHSECNSMASCLPSLPAVSVRTVMSSASAPGGSLGAAAGQGLQGGRASPGPFAAGHGPGTAPVQSIEYFNLLC
jgi:hypothetical protein